MSIKLTKFDIKTEESSEKKFDIVKVEEPLKQSVETFEFNKIRRQGEGDYNQIKQKYGPLAVTDKDRKSKKTKDQRFRINQLLRTPLAIEEEERRSLEEELKKRLEATKIKIEDEARERGYKEGFEKGKKDAYEEFRQDGTERLSKFDAFLESWEGASHTILRENERFIVEMVFQIAKRLVLKELQVDKEYILRLARNLIEKTGIKENITITVNESDLEGRKLLKDGLEKTFGEIRNLNIEASKDIEIGGCVVETNWNKIDARLETQIKQFEESLVGQRKSDPKNDSSPPEAS